MHTLSWVTLIQILCGDYETASRLVNELVTLADDKDTSFWKAWGMMNKGLLRALTGEVLDGIYASLLWDRSLAVNWSNNVLAVLLIMSGNELREDWSV